MFKRNKKRKVKFVPGRWWRVAAADGSVWMETSDENEARQELLSDPDLTLFRLHIPDPNYGVWLPQD